MVRTWKSAAERFLISSVKVTNQVRIGSPVRSAVGLKRTMEEIVGPVKSIVRALTILLALIRPETLDRADSE